MIDNSKRYDFYVEKKDYNDFKIFLKKNFPHTIEPAIELSNTDFKFGTYTINYHQGIYWTHCFLSDCESCDVKCKRIMFNKILRKDKLKRIL